MEETVKQVEALDRRILASEVDVRDLAGLQKAADDGVAVLGRLDIILANAGINTMSPTVDMTEEMWDTMIDINLTGAWKTVKAGLPHLLAHGDGGSIVLTSSLAAIIAYENIGHYSAAKHGLVGLMRSLAKELGPQNIRVNTIHPTTVNTDMVTNDATYRLFRPDVENPTLNDFKEAASTLNSLPTPWVESIDISNAVLYLVSDDGRYVTGTTHVVDAGGRL